MTYRYKILACRVIDGDSVNMTFDTGFHLRFNHNCRLAHINALEGTDGAAAKAFLLGTMSRDLTEFEVETRKADKYGRWLVEIFRRTDGGWTSVNQELVLRGLAVHYEGGKR